MTASFANPLPRLVRDERTVEEAPRAVPAEAIVCRTVTLRADGIRLQADLERELRTLLGLGGRLGR